MIRVEVQKMPLLPLIFLILLLPFVLVLLFLNVVTISFANLGLSPAGTFLFLTASLLGSFVNIPLTRRRVVVRAPFLFFYYPPVVREQVICLNLGGAGLPFLLSLYLLATRASLVPTACALAIVAVVAKLISRPQPGVGIVMPAFLPPLVAATAALLFAPRGETAAVAYIAGSMGTLLGADLLNWRALQGLGAQVVSIGGAGVFDGIFLVGVVAAFLG